MTQHSVEWQVLVNINGFYNRSRISLLTSLTIRYQSRRWLLGFDGLKSVRYLQTFRKTVNLYIHNVSLSLSKASDSVTLACLLLCLFYRRHSHSASYIVSVLSLLPFVLPLRRSFRTAVFLPCPFWLPYIVHWSLKAIISPILLLWENGSYKGLRSIHHSPYPSPHSGLITRLFSPYVSNISFYIRSILLLWR